MTGHSYKDAKKLAENAGFSLIRKCRSSHEIWKHQNGSTLLISRCGSTCYRALWNLKSQIKRLTKEETD